MVSSDLLKYTFSTILINNRYPVTGYRGAHVL